MNFALPGTKKWITWVTLAIVSLAGTIAWPEKTQGTLWFVLDSFVDVAPTITIGLVLAAWVAASGAGAVTAGWFQGHPGSTILIASAIGSVTPVCGVTVLPLMTGFLAAGVPLAPIMAFWLSSPVTDPAMFLVTWAILGPAFAIGKTVAAFALGIIAGAGTAALARTGMVQRPLRAARIVSGNDCGFCLADGFSFRIWQEAARRRVFRAELLSMAKLIVLCLGLAFSAEYLLRDLVSPRLMATYVGDDSIFAIPLAVLVGAPMYLDGYAALPLVRGLLDLGMAPGAAMALLVSGGAVSIWGAMAVVAVLRSVTMVLYLVLAVVGSLIVGYAFGAIWALLP